MKKRFLKIFLVSMIFFTILYTIFWAKFLRKDTIVASNDEVLDDVDKDSMGLEKDNEILFLMMGVDAPSIEEAKGTRTDTMMLARVNFDNGKIDILSLPRDTRVYIRGKEDKLNHAHAYGGTALTLRTVREFLEVDLNYYVKVDYKAVKSIVDAIGGVDINVPMRMYYSDPTAKPPLLIDLYPGQQILYGQEAHDFLRFRSGYPEGDLGRIQAQQYFLEELIKQSLQAKNITKLPKIIKSYYDYVETNIPLNLILKGAGVANKLDTNNINMKVVEGEAENIDGVNYLIYDRGATRELVEDMFGDYLLY